MSNNIIYLNNNCALLKELNILEEKLKLRGALLVAVDSKDTTISCVSSYNMGQLSELEALQMCAFLTRDVTNWIQENERT